MKMKKSFLALVAFVAAAFIVISTWPAAAVQTSKILDKVTGIIVSGATASTAAVFGSDKSLTSSATTAAEIAALHGKTLANWRGASPTEPTPAAEGDAYYRTADDDATPAIGVFSASGWHYAIAP